MEVWQVKNHTIEYDDDSHTYLVDGVITPSCTQLLKDGDTKYDAIPKSVLENAARLGTLLHSTIESIGDGTECSVPPEEVAEEVRGWFYLKQTCGFKVLKNELPIVIPYKGEIIAAGRFDLLLSKGGDIVLADIKRTSKLYYESVSKQLTMYNRGLQYCYDIKADSLAVIHLRKDVREYRQVSFCEQLVDGIFERRWLQRKEELNRLVSDEIVF